MSELKPNTITFDEVADLDWPYIMGAVVLSGNQIWWENVRLIRGPIDEVECLYVDRKQVWPSDDA